MKNAVFLSISSYLQNAWKGLSLLTIRILGNHIGSEIIERRITIINIGFFGSFHPFF